MATGLEAVGAASAILSFITFAGKIISTTYKIYEGAPTDEDELETFAGLMRDASERVEFRNQQLIPSTPAEIRLSGIAVKCVQLAKDLEKETQSIKKRQSKGKVLQAVAVAYRSYKHKPKLKELEQSLERYKKVMETELLFQICNKTTAIQAQQDQDFPKLDNDVQILISNLAIGHSNIESLVTKEANTTREEISKNLASQIKDSETRAITDNQRQRLLKSLKPAEIRKRYHEVLSPSDASFERVFASYERVCRKDPDHKDWKKIKTGLMTEVEEMIEYEYVDEIDEIWHSFSSWLQSDNPLFWIQGKPGSGKSTLMKFVIENENTERLLRSCSPNTKIISYFLWKIGAESQNSIKGLLCCLLHDLLTDNHQMLDQLLKQFSFLTSRDFYQEWSSEEAKEVLFFLLRGQARSTCIFIDGLDEISDKDGFGPLTRLLQSICDIPHIKVCVSSRLETGLIQRIEALGAEKLRLHDLTEPEMAVYIHKELARFSAGVISSPLAEKLTSTLLEKAQGVFLWLFLAKNSLVTGIENGDDEETLMERLEELPSELEELYESMWSRLNANNKVYRRTAAMYFHFLLEEGWNVDGVYPINDTYAIPEVFTRPSSIPTLAQLSMMLKVEEGRLFPPRVDNTSLHDLKELCDATERELGTRCAGMIQVSEELIERADIPVNIYQVVRSVQFVHRTAHDFLVDTKPGQDILSYYGGMKTTTDFQIKLFKSELYLSTVYHTIGLMAYPDHTMHRCIKLQEEGVDDEVIAQLVRVMQTLWDQGVFLQWIDCMSYRFRSFPARLACELTDMGDACLPLIIQSNSSQDPTMALRDICHEWDVRKGKGPPTQMIQRLIALGANPHAVGATSPPLVPYARLSAVLSQETSAFELLVRGALNRVIHGHRDVIPAYLEVIDSLAPSCPDWGRRTIVNVTAEVGADFQSSALQNWEFYWPEDGGATFEVNLQYLVRRLLAAASSNGISTQGYKVHQIANSAVESYSRVRNIVPSQGLNNENPFCCRVVNQEPFKNLCDNIFGPWITGQLNELIGHSFYKNPRYEFLLGSYERVMLDDEVDQLASEYLGFNRITNRKIANIWRDYINGMR
ncbi:hypothetical protein NXS19_004896 [Fusarium pseudograminearum]|nr:hypothetical protein NXS19_004896 [Fusarium pseudograminearum]